MTEQLRPVDGRQNAGEIDLLTSVAGIIRQAQVEFQQGHQTSARLEIIQAQRLLDRVFRGEVGS